MTDICIELYCLASDPELIPLRRRLKQALRETDIPVYWKEHYYETGQMKSPAFMINDQTVWKGAADGWALLSTELIKELLNSQKGKPFSWKRALRTHVSFLLALLIAFFPKCPFCWAAYMSLLSGFGINGLSYQPWLLPVFIILMFINITALYFSGKKHGYKPLILAIAGACTITLNRLYWNEQVWMLTGAILLISASLWNALPRRMAISFKHYFFTKQYR
ncbi:MAG: MerC domain-containing protein [Chitinophagaceae bacterium]|nr:MerC domain-containing protein [Chitinophagaceae bacterium]